MYLKSLTMQGFKSFPDKTRLEFGKGMTAVVGPNGSGKSNIADAVKWVLGEQSTKSLRGSKMEDVVFSGTDSRRAQGFAEVTLCLDNADRRLACDSDEVAVTRRYYRSGESEYRINGGSVRLKDIHELFMDTGLGRDGYSMVSQGRIEDMVSAKSLDRREMFEEAAGISHYRYRRADALKRLEQSKENMLRLKDILTSLEERVGPLEKQSEKAQRFLKLSSERKELEIGIWLDSLDRAARQIREQSNKHAVVLMHYEQTKKELDAMVASQQETADAVRSINEQIDAIERQIKELRENEASVRALIAVNKNSIENNAQNIQRLEKDKSLEQLTGSQLDEQLEAAARLLEERERALSEKNEALERIYSSLDSLKEKDADALSEYGEASRELAKTLAASAKENAAVSSLESSLREISLRETAIAAQLEEKKALRSGLAAELESARALLEERTQRISSLANQISAHMMLVQSRSDKAEQHRFILDKATLDLEQKKNRLSLLEDTERNMEGYQGSVKAVVKASRAGRLKGICGVLSKLITVPQEYSLAIETALAGAVQHIVTETENDARNAITMLKSEDLGRATFLPLTSVRGRSLDEKGVEKCAGYIGEASDIVSCDKKYAEVIASQLGKTVVAADMGAALSIGKKYGFRFKIVTLDGQVVNAGGSITGGSRIRSAGLISRSNEIERLGREIGEDTLALEEMRREQEELETNYRKAQSELEGARGDLLREQEDKFKASSEAELIESRLSAADEALKALSDESSSSSERTLALEKSLSEARDRLAAARTREIELRRSCDAIDADRQSISDQREAITAKANELSIEAAALSRDAENTRRTIEQLGERKSGQSDRIDRIDAQIAQINEKTLALGARIEQLGEQARQFQSGAQTLSAQRESLSAQREQCEARAGELLESEREKTLERERLSAELIRLEEKKTALMKEQEDVQSQLYDEYKLTPGQATQMRIDVGAIPEARRRLNEIKAKIRSLGSVNVAAIDEYKEVSQRRDFMKAQLDDVEESMSKLEKLIYSLTEQMAVRFSEQFELIGKNFSETFSQLFGGGKAQLVLEDENNILECGIEIKAQPPGKNVKSMSLLSGGEKGLCAIALLFAILKVTPAPFCIFDEVEAALDDVNVLRYARYLKSMTESTQFILITHRRGTMEEADILYGVTMQEKGVSKLLELKTAQMAHDLGLE